MTTPIEPAIEALTKHRRQLDADGVFVGVSRQALDELLAAYAALAQTAPAEVVGWKLVPIEPTIYQMQRGEIAITGGDANLEEQSDAQFEAKRIYMAMINAISTPTQAEAKEAGIRAAIAIVEQTNGIDRVLNRLRALLTEGGAR